MKEKYSAIYRKGAFHPQQDVDLTEGTPVKLTVEVDEETRIPSSADDRLAEFAGVLSKDEAMAMRTAITEAFEGIEMDGWK